MSDTSQYEYQPSSSNSVATPKPGAPVEGGTGSVGTPTVLPSYNYDLNGDDDPRTDLSYLSFARGYGLDSQNAQAQAAFQRASLNSQLTSQIPQFEQQRARGLTAVGNQAAGQGNSRSSAYLSAQNNVNTDVNNSELNFRNDINTKQGAIGLDLAQTTNKLAEQDAEQQLAARQRLLDVHNQQIAYQRAIQEMGYTGYGSNGY